MALQLTQAQVNELFGINNTPGSTGSKISSCLFVLLLVIVNAFLALAAAIATAIIQALIVVLQALIALLSAEEQVVGAELLLAETFVDNFIIHPVEATISTIASVTSIVQGLANYGLMGCPETVSLNNVIQQTKLGEWQRLLNRMQSYLNAAQAFVDQLSQLKMLLDQCVVWLNTLVNGLQAFLIRYVNANL